MTKLTNKHNLPQSLINAVERHEHKGGFLSASQTTKSARQFWLKKRHAAEIIEDVSDRIWAIFGTAVHYVFEENTKSGIAEQYLESKILDRTITGTPDHYENGTIKDYKTVSVWSIIYKSSVKEWERQLNTYAYLLRVTGHVVNKLEVVALMRDWQRSKAGEDNYPPIQIQVIPVILWTFNEQERYLKACIRILNNAESLKDDELPLCTREELWQDNDIWAVKKNGRKSALRVLKSKEDAEQWLKSNGGDFIEYRVGKPKRCDYCEVSAFCSQYKQIQGVK